MTRDRDIERVLEHWLTDGVDQMPDRVFQAIFDRVERQPQAVAPRLLRRLPTMNAPFRSLAAVAAVVVIGLVTFNLLGGDRSESVVGSTASPTVLPTADPSNSSTPSASAAPSPTIRPTPSPTPFACKDGGTGCVGDLTAGSHDSTTFTPAISYVVPDGWRNTIDNDFYYSLQGTDGQAPTIDVWRNVFMVAQADDCSVKPRIGVPSTVAEWVSWLTTRPGIVASTPRAVHVGAYEGTTIELRVADDWTQTCEYMDHPGVWLITDGAGFARDLGNDGTLTLTILDVGGQTVLVGIASTAAPAETAAVVAAAKPVIDSFVFTP